MLSIYYIKINKRIGIFHTTMDSHLFYTNAHTVLQKSLSNYHLLTTGFVFRFLSIVPFSTNLGEILAREETGDSGENTN